MSESVLLTRENQIATVTLNRPERLNAMTLAMWERLGEVFAELAEDDGIRAVVLRGSANRDGRRAFGAGADISEFEELRADGAQAADYARRMQPALTGLKELPHPSVALIEGPCVGGGLELAMFCHIRIAGMGARFGIPINRIGHGLALNEVRTLVELVGRPAALEMLLEGRIYKAPEALMKGLVTRVVDDDKVEAESYNAARRMAAGAPLAARYHIWATARALDATPFTEEEIARAPATCDTADYREGVRAFLAKEEPRFRGK